MHARYWFLCFCASRLLIANPNQENIARAAREPVISHIPRDQVESSAIAAIGYSKRRHILEIEFLNGAVYRYLQVTPVVYRELMRAESKARYYVANIKGKYPSAPVRPRLQPRRN